MRQTTVKIRIQGAESEVKKFFELLSAHFEVLSTGGKLEPDTGDYREFAVVILPEKKEEA
jgi:hypothetical protein